MDSKLSDEKYQFKYQLDYLKLCLFALTHKDVDISIHELFLGSFAIVMVIKKHTCHFRLCAYSFHSLVNH